MYTYNIHIHVSAQDLRWVSTVFWSLESPPHSSLDTGSLCRISASQSLGSAALLLNLCVYICIHISLSLYIYIYICMYVYIYIYIYMYMYLYI